MRSELLGTKDTARKVVVSFPDTAGEGAELGGLGGQCIGDIQAEVSWA
jgi:hypothetical protein